MALVHDISIRVERRAVGFHDELDVVALCVVRPTRSSASLFVRLDERRQLLYALAFGYVDLHQAVFLVPKTQPARANADRRKRT